MKMQWFLISLHPPPHPPSSKYPRTEKFWHWISHLSHISPFYVPSVFLGLSWGYVFLSSFPSISLASFSLADTALSGRTFSCFPFLGETGENGWSFLLLQYAQSLYGNHLETERADLLHTLRISRIWAQPPAPRRRRGCLTKTLISDCSSDNPAIWMVPEQNLTRVWQNSIHCSKDIVKAFIHSDFARCLSLAIAASSIFMLAFLVKTIAIYCHLFFFFFFVMNIGFLLPIWTQFDYRSTGGIWEPMG